jgi:hypothetical protein
MEDFINIEACPVCGRRHRYSIVEQAVAIRNSAFVKRKPNSFLQSICLPKPQSLRSIQYNWF